LLTFFLEIRSPFNIGFKHIFLWHKRIMKNKQLEFEVYRSDSLLGTELQITRNMSHAGVLFQLTLLHHTVHFYLYDIRHYKDGKYLEPGICDN